MNIKFLRNNIELVKQNQIKRFQDPQLVDNVMSLDVKYKEILSIIEKLRNKKNIISKSFKNAKSLENKINNDSINDIFFDYQENNLNLNDLSKIDLAVLSKYIDKLCDDNNDECEKLLIARNSTLR